MRLPFLSFFLFITALLITTGSASAAPRDDARELQRAGNYREAFELFSQLLKAGKGTNDESAADLQAGIDCLIQLGRDRDVDSFVESSVEANKKKWKVLATAGRFYVNTGHIGYITAGSFARGWARGGGAEVVSATGRDRVRAIQLFLAADALTNNDTPPGLRSDLYLDTARALFSDGASQLTVLTDLNSLPDYDPHVRFGRPFGGSFGDYGDLAPVTDAGDPIFHALPASFESAKTDGERWRWMLSKAEKASKSGAEDASMELARFSLSQFGVQTIGGLFRPFDRPREGEQSNQRSNAYAVESLSRDETLARISSGVKRFKLPESYNYISLFEKVARDKSSSKRNEAYEELAQIFQNRRQLPQAAEIWKEALDQVGSTTAWQDNLDQIVGAWGDIEDLMPQAPGGTHTLRFKYRNAKRVDFVAQEIDLDGVLKDVEQYLDSSSGKWDYRKTDVEQLGYRIVTEGEKRYLGREVARWSSDLNPKPGHLDAIKETEVPALNPGAYLVTAYVAGGNTVSAVLWVADTALIEKETEKGRLYFVADAVTGAPIANAPIRFFGYRSGRAPLSNNRTIETKSFSKSSGADGYVTIPHSELDNQFQWLTVSRPNGNRLAFLGFKGVWRHHSVSTYSATTRLYGITDRPVYRPEHEVKYTLWLRTASYSANAPEPSAGATHEVTIRNPRGETIDKRKVEFDRWGSAVGALPLPTDAPLGTYTVTVERHSPSLTFRVEEYKKPEFEVAVDAPATPIKLGDSFEATIKARYYFGEPVTNGSVTYKVLRSVHDGEWFPPRPWDWLYGPGYWWTTPVYDWYPGWTRWGCVGPHPWWIGPRRSSPPELVQSRTATIGADGTLKVKIDSSFAHEMMGDRDHRYEIKVEVTDESRRTVTGSGSVIAARKAFSVYGWLDHGYVRAGDSATAYFKARTPDGKPVRGKGLITLYSITYGSDRKPSEREVLTREVATDEDGAAALEFGAPAPGQYRVSYRLTSDGKETNEGAHIFSVVGPTGDPATGERLNALEILSDKAEYASGETAKLLIRTDAPSSNVLVFLRSSGGEEGTVELVRTVGRTGSLDIKIGKGDMPNFFVEAITVRDARLHTATREIVVPPAGKILNVSVTPASLVVEPGETVKAVVKITDQAGQAVSGRAVVTAYDRALEYISGGSNSSDIRKFFWEWRRRLQSSALSNLHRRSNSVQPRDTKTLQPIGVFGMIADEEAAQPLVAKQLTGLVARGAAPEAFAMAEAAPPAAADAAGEPAAEAAPIAIRSVFADTAFWAGALDIDETGSTTIEFKAPDNLTAWKIRAWGLGAGTMVGEGEAETITKKDLLVRLQTPRFLVEGDEAVISTNAHNYTDGQVDVTAKLDLEGVSLQAIDTTSHSASLEKGGEHRFDTTVRAISEGTATVTTSIRSTLANDAMQIKFPIKVHGMLRTESFSGAISKDTTKGEITFTVPEERRPQHSTIDFRFSPSLALAMVEALPYLNNFPYGCTEQTLNRFLPTLVTLETLKRQGIDLAQVREQQTRFNPQSTLTPGSNEDLPKQNPVFDPSKVEEMVKSGVAALASMQNADGGWGWFSGSGEYSSAHLSAYIVEGLRRAELLGAKLPSQTLRRGTEYLRSFEAKQLRLIQNAPTKTTPYKERADNLDAFVHHTLSFVSAGDPEMRSYLVRDRLSLSYYNQALVGLVLHGAGDIAGARQALRSIEQVLTKDDENQTSFLDLNNRDGWWSWSHDENETQATYLKLLLAIDPQSPTAPRLVKYLLNNRRNGTYWRSTRDTASVVDALSRYLTATNEAAPNARVQVKIDGVTQKDVTITPSNLFNLDNTVVITGEKVTSGEHTIEIRKDGNAPLFYAAYVTNFSLEDPLAAAGLEVRVQRRYTKLTPRSDASAREKSATGKAMNIDIDAYNKTALPVGASIESGDLIEVELEIESKNDYEYIVLEDMKAAGLEPVDVRSGYNGNPLGAYVEYRDDKTAFFVRSLPRGKRTVTYRLRAEIPGRYSALPTNVYAMYTPELRGNSDEWKVQVADKTAR